jgi:hypothetical protein
MIEVAELIGLRNDHPSNINVSRATAVDLEDILRRQMTRLTAQIIPALIVTGRGGNPKIESRPGCTRKCLACVNEPADCYHDWSFHLGVQGPPIPMALQGCLPRFDGVTARSVDVTSVFGPILERIGVTYHGDPLDAAALHHN